MTTKAAAAWRTESCCVLMLDGGSKALLLLLHGVLLLKARLRYATTRRVTASARGAEDVDHTKSVGPVYVGLFFYIYQTQFTKLLEI